MKKNKKTGFRLLLLNNYVVNFCWGLFAPLFALVVIENNGDAQTVGLTWGIYTLVVGVLMIVFGKLEDREHRHRTHLIIGNLFLILGSLAYIFVSSTAQIIGAQIIFAIGFGLYTPALKAMYARLAIKGQEATGWALMDGGNMLVMSAAAVLAGYIVKLYGLSTLFIIMAIVQTLGTIIIIRSIKKLA